MNILFHINIIPVNITSAHQIINMLAKVKDGYKVLYALLKTVHPGLFQDAIVSMPDIAQCIDVRHQQVIRYMV